MFEVLANPGRWCVKICVGPLGIILLLIIVDPNDILFIKMKKSNVKHVNNSKINYVPIGAEIMNTASYADRMIEAIGDKELARKASRYHSKIKGCPKRSSPVILNPCLVVESYLLDAIHRATSAHLAVEEDFGENNSVAKSLYSFDGSALLALGFLCEEAIRADIYDFMELSHIASSYRGKFFNETPTKSVVKGSSMPQYVYQEPTGSSYPYKPLIKFVTSRLYVDDVVSNENDVDGISKPSFLKNYLGSRKIRKNCYTRRAPFPEAPVLTRDFIRIDVNQNNSMTEENQKCAYPPSFEPSPLISYLKDYFSTEKVGNLDDLPEFDVNILSPTNLTESSPIDSYKTGVDEEQSALINSHLTDDVIKLSTSIDDQSPEKLKEQPPSETLSPKKSPLKKRWPRNVHM